MRSEPGDAAPVDGPTAPDAPWAGGARRLHPLSPVFLAVREGRRLWPIALLVLARRELWLLLLAAGVLVAAVVAEWLRRTYTLGPSALRIEEGVLARKRRLLPFDRIQQVDLVRKPLHRLLGVATLRVETAGGSGGSEADLEVIALAEAERLRATLLRARAAAQRAPAAPATPATAPTAERVLVRLSPGQVALAGLTSLRGAAALALFGSVFQEAPRSLLDRLTSRIDPQALAPSTAPALAVAALLLVALLLGLAAASSLVTDYGFVLARGGDNLVVRRGLLERREAVVPLARVQVVRVDESLLRRSLGFAAVRIQSAGRAGRGDATANHLSVPILPSARIEQLLGEVLPGAAPVPALLRPPPVARRRAILRRVVPMLVVAAVVLWPLEGLARQAGVVVAPAAVLLAALAGEVAYRNLGHARHGGFLTARRGALNRSTAVVPVAKAQSVRVRSSFFQRRVGLATMLVDVAGGGAVPRVTDEAAATAERLLTGLIGAPPGAAGGLRG
ncbi:MAG TPA: PH domain-containing protein [Actinomycetes bacterium]